MAEASGELARASARGGLGAIRRSELSRELKNLAENVETCYTSLDLTMKEYDAQKRKYSDVP